MENRNLANSEILRTIIKHLGRLEKAVLSTALKSPEEWSKKDFSGATGGVRYLVSKNFFGKKRMLGDIRVALSGHNYHYSHQAVNQALQYLSRNKGPLVKIKEKNNNYYVKRK